MTTRRELVIKIKAVLAESGLSIDEQIEALQQARQPLKRLPPQVREWKGPITKPGDKKKAKERE